MGDFRLDQHHFALPSSNIYAHYSSIMSSVPRTSYLPIHPQLHPLPPIAIAPHANNAHQSLPIARKRPKYSRSKTGCLSCRVRKVKCDEARPICTRCSHSQRECTWPQDQPKSKKSHSSGGGDQVEASANTSSRPSTSSSQAGPLATSDVEWSSDNGGGAGAIRRANSAHGRITSSHSRIPSISNISRGRELAMSSSASSSRHPSQNPSRSRDHSPNPFAYNISHLTSAGGHSGVMQHHRSASTSSVSSSASSTGLPYPLISQQPPPISTAVPRLLPSNSGSTSPLSAPQFSHSPTLLWPQSASSDIPNSNYSTRPGTSGAGIAAPFGTLHLNNGFDYSNGEAVGNAVGHDAYMSGGTFDGSNMFGSNNGFDAMGYNMSQGFDAPNMVGFDSSTTDYGNLNPSLDSSFLSQLHMQLSALPNASGGNLSSSSGHSSSESSDVEMEQSSMDNIHSLDPRALSSNHPQAGYALNQQQVGFGAYGEQKNPAPLLTSGFGSPDMGMGFGTNNALPIQHSSPPGFGANPGHSQQPLRQMSSEQAAAMGFGSAILPQQTQSSAMGFREQNPHPATGFGNHPSRHSSSPFQDRMMSNARLGFGLTSESPPHQHPHSTRTINEPEVAAESMTRSSPQMNPEDGVGRSPGGRVAGQSMDMAGVSAGAQDMMETAAATRNMNQEARHPSHSQNRPIQWGERGQGPSPSTTPRPTTSLRQTPTFTPSSLGRPFHPSDPTSTPVQTMMKRSPLQQDQHLHQSNDLPHEDQMNHARSRSDTITPALYKRNASSGRNSYDEGSDYDGVFTRASSEPESSWDEGVSGFTGAVGPNGVEATAAGLNVSPQQGQWCTLSPTSKHMIMNPDPIEPFFKSVQERNLIRHYCQTSTMLTMALPSPLNPILSIHLPIIMAAGAPSPASPSGSSSSPSPPPPDQTQAISGALSSVRPYHPHDTPLQASIEALRLSLLGVASIHQSYLLAKSGPENEKSAHNMWNLAANLRVAASRCLGAAVRDMDGCRSDAALGACVSIALIDIFAGGQNYASNMNLAKTLVTLRGGPAAIVRSSKASMTDNDENDPVHATTFKGPSQLVEAGMGSPEDHASPQELTSEPQAKSKKKKKAGVLISSARLLLEILAVYEVFSTMTSGDEPTLLKPNQSQWWFEPDTANYHLFSVEKVFGMSRSIVELFARVSSFLNGLRRGLGQHSAPGSPVSFDRLSPPPSNSPLAATYSEACALLQEVENWRDYRSPVAIHPRVHHGNEAHRYAMMILLLTEAFGVPANDSRVQECTRNTLSACFEACANFSMSVDLTWPVIIAGCQATGALRSSTLLALEGFRKQCCFEIDTSERIVTEVWRRMDSNDSHASFRSVIDDLGLRVLIL